MRETLELIDFSTCLQNLTIPCITTFKCLVYGRELLKQIKGSHPNNLKSQHLHLLLRTLDSICSRIFFVCSFNIVMHSSKFGIGSQMCRPSINLSSLWVPSWILKAEVPVLLSSSSSERGRKKHHQLQLTIIAKQWQQQPLSSSAKEMYIILKSQ